MGSGSQANVGNGGLVHGNGGNGGLAVDVGTTNGESGNNNNDKGGDGGFAIGPGSMANGENGHEGGLAIGHNSNANGGGIAVEGGNTEGGEQCYLFPLYLDIVYFTQKLDRFKIVVDG